MIKNDWFKMIMKSPGSTMERDWFKISIPDSNPEVNSSNKEARQIEATEFSLILPCIHVSWITLICSLNPWRALNSCKLDGWLLNWLNFTPHPKQQRMCNVRDNDDSELLEELLFESSSSSSAYQRNKSEAFDLGSSFIKKKLYKIKWYLIIYHFISSVVKWIWQGAYSSSI